MPTFPFVSKPNRAIRTGSEWPGRCTIDRKINIGRRNLDGNRSARPLPDWKAVSTLGKTRANRRVCSLSVQRVRKRIRIHEVGKRLAYQNVFKLGVEMA